MHLAEADKVFFEKAGLELNKTEQQVAHDLLHAAKVDGRQD